MSDDGPPRKHHQTQTAVTTANGNGNDDPNIDNKYQQEQY
jgi:hypothetical protein